MPLARADSIKDQTQSNGPASFTLDSIASAVAAPSGYMSVAGAVAAGLIANGATLRLRIENATNTEWCDAEFTINTATGVLTRVATFNGSSGAATAVTFSAGAKAVTLVPTIKDFDVPDFAAGAAIASAATVNLDNATGGRVHITGTTTITAVTLSRGPRTVIFDGVLTLTHHATNLNLPGAKNILTAAGDRAIFESDGTTVYCTHYTQANPWSSGTPGFTSATGALGSGGSLAIKYRVQGDLVHVLFDLSLGLNGTGGGGLLIGLPFTSATDAAVDVQGSGSAKIYSGTYYMNTVTVHVQSNENYARLHFYDGTHPGYDGVRIVGSFYYRKA